MKRETLSVSSTALSKETAKTASSPESDVDERMLVRIVKGLPIKELGDSYADALDGSPRLFFTIGGQY